MKSVDFGLPTGEFEPLQHHKENTGDRLRRDLTKSRQVQLYKRGIGQFVFAMIAIEQAVHLLC